ARDHDAVADGGLIAGGNDAPPSLQVFLAPRAREIELHGRERERDDHDDEQAQEHQLLTDAQAHAHVVYQSPSPAGSEAERPTRSFSPHARRRAPAATPAKRATFRGFGRRRIWPRPCLAM